jgi:hypothetical protein
MNTRTILGGLALVAGTSTAGLAQTATQVVSFQVQGINRLSFSGSPSILINDAVAGNAPTSASASGSWALTTNQTNQKVTASIGSAMPSGLTLSANLVAPSGATSSTQPLGTVAVDVVTGITKLNTSGLGVTYTLDATSDAGVVALTSRTVTYTLTTGA